MRFICILVVLISAAVFSGEKLTPEQASAKLAELKAQQETLKAQQKLNRESLFQKLDAENKGLFDDPKLKPGENVVKMYDRHTEYAKLISTREDADLLTLSTERNKERLMRPLVESLKASREKLDELQRKYDAAMKRAQASSR